MPTLAPVRLRHFGVITDREFWAPFHHIGFIYSRSTIVPTTSINTFGPSAPITKLTNGAQNSLIFFSNGGKRSVVLSLVANRKMLATSVVSRVFGTNNYW